MKKTLFIFAFSCWIGATAQETPPLYLEYDNAGNQVVSDPVCINCPGEEVAKHTLDKVSYYPNPVEEQLVLNWEHTPDNRITAVKVYALNGRLITSKSNLNPYTQLHINFRDKAAGIYIIEMVSSDGKKRGIKVIKK